MRVLICGGRNYEDYDRFKKIMQEIAFARFPKTPEDEYGNFLWAITVISGGATGADECAAAWAAVEWTGYEEYKAEWEDLTHTDAIIRMRKDGTKYDAKAGHRRNMKMLTEGKPDLVIAFPGGAGTADMVRIAKAAGVEVLEVK